MFNTIKTAAIAGLIGLTALAAVPAKADDGIYLRLRRWRRSASISGDSGRAYRRDRYRDEYRDDEYRDEFRRSERRCTPERALYKAERIGVRRARIADVSRRTISVVGRSRGERVYVTFARAPQLPDHRLIASRLAQNNKSPGGRPPGLFALQMSARGQFSSNVTLTCTL